MTDDVVPFHRKFWTAFGTLEHWFLPSPAVTEFKLLSLPTPSPRPRVKGANGYHFERIVAENFERFAGDLSVLCAAPRFPHKTPRYIQRRFLEHPVYHYHVALAYEGARIAGLAVLRQVEHAGRSALRMVDFWATRPECRFPSALAHGLLDSTGAEYIDFYGHGFDTAILRRNGFLNRAERPEAIVPNYFEPFERKNIDLRFAHWSEGRGESPYLIVKADADQDRPSVLAQSAAKAVVGGEPCKWNEARF
jgi:hypothetical protein